MAQMKIISTGFILGLRLEKLLNTFSLFFSYFRLSRSYGLMAQMKIISAGFILGLRQEKPRVQVNF